MMPRGQKPKTPAEQLEAVKDWIEHPGERVADIAARHGVSRHSLYQYRKKFERNGYRFVWPDQGESRFVTPATLAEKVARFNKLLAEAKR